LSVSESEITTKKEKAQTPIKEEENNHMRKGRRSLRTKEEDVKPDEIKEKSLPEDLNKDKNNDEGDIEEKRNVQQIKECISTDGKISKELKKN